MITGRQFSQGLRRMELTPTDRKMLRQHASAPQRAITCLEMGRRMGWKGKAANMHYGTFAKRLCKTLRYTPPPESDGRVYYVAAVVTFEETRAGQVCWVMRKNFARALRQI